MKDKKIVIIGISGFIGRIIGSHLAQRDIQVWGLSRNPQALTGKQFRRVHLQSWDGTEVDGLAKRIAGADAVINLAGENIGSGLWSRKKKGAILTSRVRVGAALTQAILSLPVGERPAVLQASAVGFYGSRGDDILDEQSPKGNGFLPNVVEKWEHAVNPLEEAGIRVILLRFGVVWAAKGGALPRILMPFRTFVGGTFGDGAQFMSWIHYLDVIKAIEFLLRRDDLAGVFNITSPNPIRNRDFAAIADELLRGPNWLRIPPWILRLILRDAADEMLLSSQRVVPRRLLDEGFTFNFPDVKISIQYLLSRENNE